MITRNRRATNSTAASRRRLARRPPEPRLNGAGHPHLAPPGWAAGTRLRALLRDGPLTTAEATAVGLAVLSALGELQRQGRSHGAVGLDSVGIGADGWIRLAADDARANRQGPAGDLADAGRLLCELLGVPVALDPAAPTPEAEKAAPALVAVARRLASGVRWSADEAWAAVHDAAGFCGTEPQLVRALGELAERAAGGAVQRAVTRVLPGPPLGTETAAAPPGQARRPSLPAVRLRRPVLPALPVPEQPLTVPRLPRPRSMGRWGALLGALLLTGILLGGLSAVLTGRPAAAHTAARASARRPPPPRAPATPASLYAQTPDAAVATFFQLVQQQQLDQAALLWKPKMNAAVDLQSRFSGLQSVTLQHNQVVAEDDSLGVATVAVDWVETDADGSTHEFAGQIFTATGPLLWRWDSWDVHEVVQPPPDNGGGGGNNGGGDGG